MFNCVVDCAWTESKNGMPRTTPVTSAKSRVRVIVQHHTKGTRTKEHHVAMNVGYDDGENIETKPAKGTVSGSGSVKGSSKQQKLNFKSPGLSQRQE